MAKPAPHFTGPWVLDLPYSKPPLSLNQRYDWRKKARINAEVRRDTALLARLLRLPRGLDYCEVALHYTPNTERSRDEDNLMLTVKPAIDGLRDYGMFADDDHTHVRSRVQIHDKASQARVWLTITDLTLGAP